MSSCKMPLACYRPGAVGVGPVHSVVSIGEVSYHFPVSVAGAVPFHPLSPLKTEAIAKRHRS